MATLLNDQEIKRLIGSVIVDGDTSCIRSNSYILRLGANGEFLNAQKEFVLGKKKKGVRVQPGHSIAVTAFETLDFRRETVRAIYPDHDLHAFVTPTTDLSREGIVASTTQVDAGYHGTLNWTLSNTSSEERRFILKEKIYRLTILKLAQGETPEEGYQGDYQGRTGYVRSQRRGAPTGMRDEEWEDSFLEGGPEQLLDSLLKSGYPWHLLGERLRIIDQQFKSVTDEYAEIRTSLDRLTSEVDVIGKQNSEAATRMSDLVRNVIAEQAQSLQNRWLIVTASFFVVIVGLALSIAGNDAAKQFLERQSAWIGVLLVLVGIGVILLVLRRETPRL